MSADFFFQIEILKDGAVVKTLPKIHTDKTITIGRDESCNITIPDVQISRLHASLRCINAAVSITDENSTNSTRLDELELVPHQAYPITDGAQIKFGDGKYGLKILMSEAEVQKESSATPTGKSELFNLLEQKNSILIGRAPNCDIVLSSLMVSREHARIDKQGDQYVIYDLESTNGVFVNGKRISGSVAIGFQDNISIGPSSFYLQAGEVKRPYAIVADNIEKKYPDGHVGLQKMSIKIPSNEFGALMGPSGCGKSTLLKGLNGANPVTSGTVTIQGLKLNQENFRILKRNIGYVPQDDIIHRELTLSQTMYYAAKLRIAEDVTDEEIDKKIEEVLEDLNIANPELRTKKIAELSGGQRKRVSIAVELLSDPTILFLDEPTSPLDPETIADFLGCIQKLTEDGKTVVMVTHKPSDLQYVNKVIFLSAGGAHVFYGSEKELKEHFGDEDIIKVYAEVKTVEKAKPWKEKWQAENEHSEVITPAEKITELPSASGLQQLYWLSRRYLSIKLNDRKNLRILMLQPIVIAILMGLIFNHFDSSVLFLMAISAIWFGVSNAAKEIVGEQPIYERERMYNLNILNYMFSKLLVLSLFAFIQAATFVAIIYYFYHNPGEGAEPFKGYWSSTFFMFYLSFSATLFGLLISAFFETTEEVMSIVPIALIPQILLAGVIAQIDADWKNILSYPTLGRWGTEGFCHLQDDLGVNAAGISDSLGVNIPVFDPIQDTMMHQPGNAVNHLKFYGNIAEVDTVTWTWSNSFQSNVLSILVLNVIIFLVIFILLKRKDKQF